MVIEKLKQFINLTVSDMLNPTYVHHIVTHIVHSFFPTPWSSKLWWSFAFFACSTSYRACHWLLHCLQHWSLGGCDVILAFLQLLGRALRGFDCVSKPLFLKQELRFDIECPKSIAIDDEQLILNELLNIPR